MKSLLRVLSAIRLVIITHPLPLLASFFAFAFVLWENHTNLPLGQANNYLKIRLFLEALAALLLFFAADIMVRWHQFDRYKRIGLYLTIICILGIHFYSIKPFYFQSDGVFFSRYVIFFICYYLILSLSAYMQQTNDDLLWQFNYRLLITLAQSIGFTIVLLIGVLSAVWAIENLFGLDVEPKLYGDIILFKLLVVHTLIFLVLFPKHPNEFQHNTAYPQWLRVFAQYIVLPLVLIYGSLLYVYVLKILLTQKVPNGWVCIPVLLYTAAGLLAFSLLYPLRNDRENKTVFTFMRYFFYTLLPLLTLYFIALWLRIGPYGVTENRYVLCILGVWLSALAIYWIIKKEAPLMLIPQSLLLCLFFSVVGPWGMYQVSERSQTKRLHHLLEKHHFISNNQWSFNQTTTDTIPENDAEAIRSIFNYLQERDALMAIHPWLKPEEQDWLTTQLKNNQSNEAVKRLINAMNLTSQSINEEYTVLFRSSKMWTTQQAIPLQGSNGHLVHVNWYPNQTLPSASSWPAQLQQNVLTYNDTNTLDLTSYIKQLNQFQLNQKDSLAKRNEARGAVFSNNEPIHDINLNDSLSQSIFPNARLFINQINVSFYPDSNHINLLDAYLWYQ